MGGPLPGALLPRSAARGPPRRQRARRRDGEARRRARAPRGRDAPGAVPAPRGLSRPRGARLHCGGLCPRRSAPAQDIHARTVFQDAGRDGRRLRRPSGGAREFRRDRAALQRDDSAGQEFSARLSHAAFGHPRRPPAQRSRSRTRAAARHAVSGCRDARREASRLRRATRLRDHHHRADGVRRLFPDRRRLHQLGEGQRRAGGPGTRFRRGLARRLRARHHRPRSRCATGSCSSGCSIPSAYRCRTSTSTSARTAATA